MATVIASVQVPMVRRGDWWDVLGLRRYALWAMPHLPGLEPPDVGSPLFPPHDDLPYLMVVESVVPLGASWLVRTVAHDVAPPPTLYLHEGVEAP
jgi:hypothetical protein